MTIKDGKSCSKCLNTRNNFFILKMDKLETTQKLLLFTPHQTFWVMCIYHEWILGFDPNNLMGLKIPTWIRLKQLPIK
jgi:hypothetical protein